MKKQFIILQILVLPLMGCTAFITGDAIQAAEPYAIITSCQLDEDFYPTKTGLTFRYDFDESNTWQNPEHQDMVVSNCRGDADGNYFPVSFIAVDGMSGKQGRVGHYRVHPGKHTMQVVPELVGVKYQDTSSSSLPINIKKFEVLEVKAGYRYVLAAEYHGGATWNWSFRLLGKRPISGVE